MYKLFHALFSEKLFLKNFCKQLFCIIYTCNFLSQVSNENFANFYHKFTWEYCRVHNFSAKIVHNQKVGVEALLVGPTKLHIKFFVHQKFKRTAVMFHRTSYQRWARAASDGRAKRAKPKPSSDSKLAAGEALRRCAWGVAPPVGRSCRGQIRRGSTSGCWLWNGIEILCGTLKVLQREVKVVRTARSGMDGGIACYSRK